MVSRAALTPEMIEHIEAPDLLPTDFNEDMLLKELSSNSPPPAHPSLLFAETAPVAGAVAVGAGRKRRAPPTVTFTLEEAKEASDEKLQEGFTMVAMVDSDNLYGDDGEEEDDGDEPSSEREEEDDEDSGDEAMDRPPMVRT